MSRNCPNVVKNELKMSKSYWPIIIVDRLKSSKTKIWNKLNNEKKKKEIPWRLL